MPRNIDRLIEVTANLPNASPADDKLNTALEALDAQGGGGSGVIAWAQITMSVDFPSPFPVGQHVPFDTIIEDGGGSISLSTGVGQANGTITLTGGKDYLLTFSGRATLTNAGSLTLTIALKSSGIPFGSQAKIIPVTKNELETHDPTAMAILSPSVNTEFIIRNAAVIGFTNLKKDGTILIIREV